MFTVCNVIKSTCLDAVDGVCLTVHEIPAEAIYVDAELDCRRPPDRLHQEVVALCEGYFNIISRA